MARKVTAEVVIKATDKASPTVKKTEKSFTKLGNFLKVGFVAAGAAAVAILRKLSVSMEQATTAASAQQDAVEGLRAQLSALGPAADGVTAALAKQAAELQSITRFGDEATIAAQTQLAVFTQSEEGIKRLTVASQDFATAQGIGLVQASQLLAKTLGSTTNSLSRYGIVVEGAAGSSERLDSLVGNLAELFGGRATAAANTYAGALEQLANAHGDTAEAIGKLKTENESLIAVMQERVRIAEDTTAALNREAEAAGSVATAVEKLKLKWDEFKLGLVLIAGDLLGVETRARTLNGAMEEMGKTLGFDAQQAQRAREELEALNAAEDEATAKDFADVILNEARAMDEKAEATRRAEEIERQAIDAAAALKLEVEAEASAALAATQANDSAALSFMRLGTAADGAAASSQRYIAVTQQAIVTAAQFDAIARTGGRGAAVSAATAGGGRLVQAGRVIELEGGGSRLVNPPDGFSSI